MNMSRADTSIRLVGNLFLLTKPLITVLLLSTTLGAMLVAARGLPSLSLVLFTLLGGALCASGSSALNSYIDRDIDPEMGRTSQRPIPLGLIHPNQALGFGLVSVALGFTVLAVYVNWLSAALALFGAVYYVGFYTLLLKRSTPQNIVIGGLAGAIPPLVGWVAVTGQLNLLAIYLCLIIFYWTPPHTWALMLMVTKDYQRVRVPMLPVVRGEPETRRQIVLYSVLLMAITVIPFSLHVLGWIYLVGALLLGGRFLQLAVKLLRDESKATARKLYTYSNAYLAMIFLAMVLDRVMLEGGPWMPGWLLGGAVFAIALVSMIIAQSMLIISAWQYSRQVRNDTGTIHAGVQFELMWASAPVIFLFLILGFSIQLLVR